MGVEEVTRLGERNLEKARKLKIKFKDKMDKLKITATLKNCKNVMEDSKLFVWLKTEIPSYYYYYY